MGKVKLSKSGESIPQKHLHSRISFLHQAATYLSATTQRNQRTRRHVPPSSSPKQRNKHHGTYSGRPQTHYLLNQLRGISKKSQIRLGRDMKHSICKNCDSLMIPGQTSLQTCLNESKDGSKPWAAVFEVRCTICQKIKRFPIGTKISSEQSQPPTAEYSITETSALKAVDQLSSRPDTRRSK